MILSMNRPSNKSIKKPRKVEMTWNSLYQVKQARSYRPVRGAYKLLNTLVNSNSIFELPIMPISNLLLF